MVQGEIPDDEFEGKVVFVGQHFSTGFAGDLKDEFGTAHTHSTGTLAPGVEIHAMAFLNLKNGDWLNRTTAGQEQVLVVLIAVLLGSLLPLIRPMHATLVSLGVGVLLLAAGWGLFTARQTWLPW